MRPPAHRGARPARRRLVQPVEAAALAVVCFLPLLLGARGRLNADTKQYLYLDPGELMERARSLWDTSVGGGAVTHQTVGYLWPMGPYYWLLDRLGVPDWIAQRIWVGGIELVAALGALVLFRTLLRGREPGHVVAALGYGLSPFLLGHITGQSALVLPFAAFPWMVWALVRGLDDRTWRWPALYALIVTTCGSLNGSSVFFVVLGSVLWVPFGVHTLGRAGARDGVVLLVRAGALTLLTQLWWLVAYVVGGRHGLPVLSLTETVQATSSTTSAAEVLRGLGYWYFYGGDPHRPWLPDIAGPYMTSPFLLTVSFAVPVAALLLASRLRWSSRAYFAALITIGTLIATISFSSPWRSPAGVAFEEASRRADVVLSLRNTQRAGPLVALGLMGLLAAALSALRALRRGTSARVVLVMAVLVVVALPGQWDGLIAERFHREEVPSYWHEAGRTLDKGEGNVLELPGIDFAAYRWGNTLDPVSVGLTDRPVIARELIPQGGPVGISLLNALDRSLQEGWAEPEAIAPMARLLGASTILARNDLEYERYRTARPRRVWGWLVDPRAGLGRPVAVGVPVENRAAPDRPTLDEIELGMGPGRPIPPIGLFEVVDGDRPPMSTHGTRSATVVDGSGEGFYNAGAAGLLDDLPGALLLGADLARLAPEQAAALAGPGARYVITDSNRKQDELWYSLRENVGATEPTGGSASDRDEAERRIDLVEGTPDGARTTVRWLGADRVWATNYGGGATLLPEDRPSNAFDGDVATSWRVAGSLPSAAPTVSVQLSQPSTAAHVDLIQPQARPGSQPVPEMVVVLDGERRFPVEVDPDEAFDPAGVRVRLDGRPFTRLDVELTGADHAFGSSGLAEVRIPGRPVREVVQLPTTTLEHLGSKVGSAPLAIVLSRLRADPAEPLRSDPELRMVRELDLPGPVVLTLDGTVRLRPSADDGFGEELTGTTGPFVRASEHLPGAAGARGSAAFDDVQATAWTTPFVGIEDQWLEVEVPTRERFDSIALDVVADERHSLPRVVSVSVDGDEVARLALPRIERGALGTVRHVELPLDRTVAGRTIRITVEEAEPLETNDWYTDQDVALPVALAEVTIPGVDPVERSASVDTGCRDDLLTVDGAPVEVRVTGSVAGALTGAPLRIAACDGPLALDAGTHLIETASGFDSGLDLDRLVLRSAAWGTSPPSDGPEVSVGHESRGHVHGRIADQPGDPFWLVVDQSANDGWRLEVEGEDGTPAEVDGPHPMDGNAVGWLVRPAAPGGLDVRADWTPGGAVDVALALSGLGAVGCLAIAVLSRRPEDVAVAPYGPPRLTRGPDVAWRRGLPGAAATAVVAGLCVHPLAAVPAGLAMAVFTSRPRWGRFIPPALIALSALGVVVVQVRDEVVPGGGWPARFGFAHFFTLIAVLILGSEAITEATRHRGARLRREAWEQARRDSEAGPTPPAHR